jgi:hypothetical protein
MVIVRDLELCYKYNGIQGKRYFSDPGEASRLTLSLT